MNPILLIVDDDEEIRTQIKWGLSEDYSIVQAADRKSAIEKFRVYKPMVVLLDLGLPPNPSSPEEGLAGLNEMLSLDPRSKIVIASANRLMAVRQYCRNRKRTAEISVPAWPIPIHHTKLVMSQAHATGLLLPQTPMPVQSR